MIHHKSNPTTIDEYIALFPKEIQQKLESIRETIRKAAPKAVEIISYRMPAFKLNGVLVYFAAFKNHIGFFPTSSGIKAFENQFTGYKYSKGAVQFPIDKKLPLGLISKIVKYRVKENLQKKMKK